MGYGVRLLADEELPAAWEMGRKAFGSDLQPPAGWLGEWPGRHRWGAFDSVGRLVAQAMDREQGHWFGGRLVPASGVAGVVVTPELRGCGLARKVLTSLLAAARDRGAVISTLFDTSPVPYRRLGWEEVGALTWTTLPTVALAGIRRPEEVTLRSATEADVPALLRIYQSVARCGNGLMERSGPLFATSPEAVLTGHDGITVAAGPDGGIDGYASWDRGPGSDVTGRLSVPDLIGLTASATSGLLAMLGRWASVAPTLALRLPDPDPAFLLASSGAAQVESRNPWMLRILDAAGAVAARGWPPHLDGSVDLILEDDLCPWNAGPRRFVLAGGMGRLELGGRARVRLSMRGFAVLYGSAGSPALLRRAGLLHGGDASTDAFLQAAAAGPTPALLDSF